MGRRKIQTGIESVEGNTVVISDAGAFSNHLKAISLNKPSKIIIKKAKIINDLFLKVEYSEIIYDSDNTVKKDCSAPVHDDLKASFAQLDTHLSALGEQFDGDGAQAACTCTGFTISTGDDGVVLIGNRSIEAGVLNLVTPPIKWDDDYDHINEVAEAIEGCKSEVMQYLFEGKHQPGKQPELPFDEEKEEGGQ